jgi:hypothetical protein
VVPVLSVGNCRWNAFETKRRPWMATLLDYLEWRGDLSFDQDPCNEIDGLILSILSYADFNNLVPQEADSSAPSLAVVAQKFLEQTEETMQKETFPFFKEIPEFLEKVATTRRFGEIIPIGFEDQTDLDKTKQFAAITFMLTPQIHFVAFRGTDTSLVGCKEDLQMSFMDEVPAQIQAAIYLKRILNQLKGDFIVGGHSKGGNLAVYATMNVPAKHAKRIVNVYNNDGPGFQSHVVESKPYRDLLPKVMTFIPRASIVGLLFEQSGNIKVVESRQVSIMQHDPLSWEVKGPRFLYGEGLSKSTIAFSNALRTWMAQVTKEERAGFVESLGDLMESTGAKTFEELTQEKLQATFAVLKAYNHMDKETKANLKKLLELFFKESGKSIREVIKDEIEQLLPRKNETKTEITQKQKSEKTR